MNYYRDQLQQLQHKFYPDEQLVKQIKKAKKFIDTHYTNSIDLDDMARSAFFSKFHFTRLFKKLYGETPHQYLRSVRITRAKTLLQKGRGVLETSLSVGFDSPTSFTNLFKQRTGTTPSAFRSAHLKK